MAEGKPEQKSRYSIKLVHSPPKRGKTIVEARLLRGDNPVKDKAITFNVDGIDIPESTNTNDKGIATRELKLPDDKKEVKVSAQALVQGLPPSTITIRTGTKDKDGKEEKDEKKESSLEITVDPFPDSQERYRITVRTRKKGRPQKNADFKLFSNRAVVIDGRSDSSFSFSTDKNGSLELFVKIEADTNITAVFGSEEETAMLTKWGK
jgi:hypothetical protein